MTAFYELRQYTVLPGKMDEWVKFMEDEIIPFQVAKGMVICGSFKGEEDERDGECSHAKPKVLVFHLFEKLDVFSSGLESLRLLKPIGSIIG